MKKRKRREATEGRVVSSKTQPGSKQVTEDHSSQTVPDSVITEFFEVSTLLASRTYVVLHLDCPLPSLTAGRQFKKVPPQGLTGGC